MYVADDTVRTTSLANNQISASRLLATLEKTPIKKWSFEHRKILGTKNRMGIIEIKF